MFGSGEVVCVQASGLHGRGFESSVMPKLSPFWLFYTPRKNDDRDARHPNPAMNQRKSTKGRQP